MSDVQIWVILSLSVLTVILITLGVYYARRKVLCFFPMKPWCWTDWTCVDSPPGSKERCPVLPTQEAAQSCVPEDPTSGPGCVDVWDSATFVARLS